MKAAGLFVGAVIALEAIVLVEGLLVAGGLQETQSTVLSVAAILGGLGVIVTYACKVLRRVRALYLRADSAIDNVHAVPTLRQEIQTLRSENTEIRDLLQKICDRLRIDEPGADRRATDQ